MMEWFGRCKEFNKNDLAQMSIRKSQRTNQYNIYFRNEVAKLLIMDSYVEFAVDGNRLYFRGTNNKNGIKIVKRKGSFFSKITDNKGRLERFVGDYYTHNYNKDIQALWIEPLIIDGREKRK